MPVLIVHPRQLKQLALAVGMCAALAPAVLAQAGASCNPHGSTDEVNACAVREFQKTDTEIQVLYGDVMRIQSAHERPALRREQATWMRERNARCRRETAARQSQPEWPRLLHECLTRETRARRAGLLRWMSAEPPVLAPSGR